LANVKTYSNYRSDLLNKEQKITSNSTLREVPQPGEAFKSRMQNLNSWKNKMLRIFLHEGLNREEKT
jgi:hypothetical protein